MKRHIRPIRIEGNIAYITLTQGYEAVIDAADVHLVEGRNWFARVTHGNAVYAESNLSHPRSGQDKLHRIIIGDTPGLQIDHIDGDGLNNRRGNLRLATHSQNMQNRPLFKNNKSGFKGVSYRKDSKCWRAEILSKGDRHILGKFNCPTAAHFAYVKASRELHGEFGRIS